ncbi:MAG: LPP20 family lipoprotein [Gammaproteobacteria bacterium]|nr:LPP20 family lipoprotein [Gammaproteobacteria bacterium]MCF6230954.1 LPP20 family lipoprotein [Gammaproteobacteria bacterium]
MRISIKPVAGLALVVLLVGCSGQEKIVMDVPDCVFPDSPTVAAPAWICDAPVEGIAVSAVGMFRKTNAGAQFQKTQATAAARNMLAAQMKVHVKQLVKNYSEVTGVGDDETVDTVSSDVSKQVTAATLYGSKVYKTRANPESGALYVLVGLDPDQAAAQATEALKTSYKNKKAQWQKFLAGKAHDELDAEFDKIANQDL